MRSIQKTREISGGCLTLVPTPIGNDEDFTPRALSTLRGSDLVLCEDTRTSALLLSRFDVHVPFSPYHLFNEREKADEYLELVKAGKRVSLVTDAGVPGISDPGYLIVRRALDEGLPVVSLPGPSAGITALVASGLPTERYLFYGFLDHRESVKRKELNALRENPCTMVFYESPERVVETLALMLEILGDREACLARELTKPYEEYRRGLLSEILSLGDAKGEIVLIIAGKKNDEDLLSLSVPDHFTHYLTLGYEPKEAMKLVARDRGIPKSDVYKELEKAKDQ